MTEIAASVKRTLERWKTSASSKIARRPAQSEAGKWIRSRHFWIITALMAFLTFTYYLDQTPLAHISPFEHSFLTGVHDLHRTLFLIPLIYAAVIFRVRGSLLASLVFLGVVVPRSLLISPYPDPILRALVFVIVAASVSLLVAIELNRVDGEHAKLQQFLAETMSRQEREKQHLARELHDESLQTLVDISHEIDELVEAEDRANTQSRLKNLRHRMDTVLTGIRQFIMGIRPPLLEEMGLGPSLNWLAEEMAEERGLKISMEIKGNARRLTDIVELNLFRIAQEALQNAKKHSRATRITIRLAFVGDKAQLTIQDNGAGFSIPAREKLAIQAKFGLIGMAERAHLIGGSLRVESSWEIGTIVYAEVPISRVEPELSK